MLPTHTTRYPLAEESEDLISRFVRDQATALSSRQLYAKTIRRYFVYLTAHGKTFNQVSRPDIIEYRDYLIGHGFSPLTMDSYITVVRKFYTWTQDNLIYPNIANKIPGVKRTEKTERYRKYPLSVEQSINLIRYMETQQIRDYALVNLLIRTGLRLIEVHRANTSDITMRGENRVLMVQGKGRESKNEFVVLSGRAWAPLARYLSSRTDVRTNSPLFISDSPNSMGERLTVRSMSGIVKEALKAIGINARQYTAHSLRHTMAVSMLMAGASMKGVQEVLRHVNSDTTEIYTRFFQDELRIQNPPELLIDKLF